MLNKIFKNWIKIYIPIYLGVFIFSFFLLQKCTRISKDIRNGQVSVLSDVFFNDDSNNVVLDYT